MNPESSSRIRGRCVLPALLAAVALAASGCEGNSSTVADRAAKPFEGVSLTLHSPDPAFRAAITPAVQSWAARTGAGVNLVGEPMAAGDGADIGIIPAGEVGAWAERGDLAPVPAALRAGDHPFQWTGLFPAYREYLIEWGGQARAVPLAGDGFIIVYRADRVADPTFVAAFRKRFGRDPAAPTTWEDFADLAAAFAELDGKPSLPPMPPTDVADLFFRVAACFDRPALNDAAVGRGAGEGGLSFQFDLETAAPRLGTAPGFAAAAAWLAGLTAAKALPPVPQGGPGDPAAALADGRAALAVLPLAQVAKLPREANGAVPARFALAPLPGTRTVTDPAAGTLVPAAGPNYTPYFAGGRFGVVRTRCPHPDAAFDLLADLGGPARSLELVADPRLGVGPFRASHLERDRLLVWFGYGFDADRSKQLQDAMRQYVRTEVKNPAYGLRGPDAAPLNAAAAEGLAKVAAGTVPPDAGLKNLVGAWNRIDEKTPRDTRLRWRKLAAGLN